MLVILPSHFVAAVVGVAWFNDSIKLTLVWPKSLGRRGFTKGTTTASPKSSPAALHPQSSAWKDVNVVQSMKPMTATHEVHGVIALMNGLVTPRAGRRS